MLLVQYYKSIFGGHERASCESTPEPRKKTNTARARARSVMQWPQRASDSIVKVESCTAHIHAHLCPPKLQLIVNPYARYAISSYATRVTNHQYMWAARFTQVSTRICRFFPSFVCGGLFRQSDGAACLKIKIKRKCCLVCTTVSSPLPREYLNRLAIRITYELTLFPCPPHQSHSI